MSTLTITITNADGAELARYAIPESEAATAVEDRRRAGYLLNRIRAAAEVYPYYADFPEPPCLRNSAGCVTVDFADPMRALRAENVEALWLEIENLLRGARLNFAESRVLKAIELEFSGEDPESRNTRYDLHFDKMERFYLAVFELARIEDLIVRVMFEYFGESFIEVDQAKKGWEKRLTWDAMKDRLNARGKPEKSPHSRVDAMRGESAPTEFGPMMTVVVGEPV